MGRCTLRVGYQTRAAQSAVLFIAASLLNCLFNYCPHVPLGNRGFPPSRSLAVSTFSVASYHSIFFGAGPHAPVAPLCTIRPALKDLVRFAVPRIAAMWYDVGLQLDLEPYVLDEIEKERSGHPRKMFTKWLQGSSCSWQNVLDAVKWICGAKPMEDVYAAVVESLQGAPIAGQLACMLICLYCHIIGYHYHGSVKQQHTQLIDGIRSYL